MSGQRLLVTGATGFVGAHVQAACTKGGAFDGWSFHPAPPGLDVRDAEALAGWVCSVRPDAVLHLAAQSFVPRSFDAPRETIEINLLGTLSLLQALERCEFAGRMVFVSSGDVYGRVSDEALPVSEKHIPEPRSPYAVSKIAAEQLCMQWRRTGGLEVMIARPFNHVGPGQDVRFVLPALAHQVVAVAEGSQLPVIEVGDIDVTRDFTDVRDIVAAYAAMIVRGTAGTTYVVGSGRERSVRELLEAMCAQCGITPEIRQDPTRIRPAEQRRMVAEASHLHRETGWLPVIPFETTLQDILKDAKSKI